MKTVLLNVKLKVENLALKSNKVCSIPNIKCKSLGNLGIVISKV